MSVRDEAQFEKWKKWHSGCKRELKRLITKGAELDKEFDLSGEMKWGRLDRYKPDLTWERDNELSFFEVEYYYDQDKIVRDVVYAHLLKGKQLLFVFSNKRTEWGNGEKRKKATDYLAGRLLSFVKPLCVKTVSVSRPKELKKQLEEIGIL